MFTSAVLGMRYGFYALFGQLSVRVAFEDFPDSARLLLIPAILNLAGSCAWFPFVLNLAWVSPPYETIFIMTKGPSIVVGE